MRNLFSILTLCGVTSAQTVAFTDPATQIAFQTWANAINGFKFSLALPEAAGTDLIAQIAPLKDGVGWAGISLGPTMLNNPLIAVWTNAGKIQSSIRKSPQYASPPVFESDIVLKPIAAGTSSNATHLTYTFLCQKCNLQGSRFLSWAMSTDPVPTPEDVAGSKLGMHKAGFGRFGVDVDKAKNKGFAGWAAEAT